jgi:hypothetical protein
MGDTVMDFTKNEKIETVAIEVSKLQSKKRQQASGARGPRKDGLAQSDTRS